MLSGQTSHLCVREGKYVRAMNVIFSRIRVVIITDQILGIKKFGTHSHDLNCVAKRLNCKLARTILIIIYLNSISRQYKFSQCKKKQKKTNNFEIELK